MKEEYAKFLLKKIKEDYEKIAQDFSQKRGYLPRDFFYFKQFLRKKERILDLGCGNGRFFEIAKETDYFGVDISKTLIEIARKKYPQGKFYLIEPLKLPFEDNFFDKVFCLSVFHHLPGKNFRLQFLKEIKRVLKKEGLLIITVWNLFEKRKIKLLLFKYAFLKIIGKTKIDFFDIFLPWKETKKNMVIQRYFHVFTLFSLKKIIKEAGFEIQKAGVLARSKKESNLFVIARPHK